MILPWIEALVHIRFQQLVFLTRVDAGQVVEHPGRERASQVILVSSGTAQTVMHVDKAFLLEHSDYFADVGLKAFAKQKITNVMILFTHIIVLTHHQCQHFD